MFDTLLHMIRQMPARWTAKGLVITDSVLAEADALQAVYDDCAYIGEWTGGKEDHPKPILKELHHENLPPKGKKNLHRLQSVRTKASGELIGYIAFYHGFPHAKTLWIVVLAVGTKYQGKKYGQEIIKEFARQAKRLKYTALGGCVSIKNWPAVRFWVQAGLNRIARFEGDKIHSGKTFADLWLIREL